MVGKEKLLEILERYWGYKDFRLIQESVISSILSNKDTLALMPTGGGKSLCYQVPALARPGLCLVVSPLISLMVDQVNELKDRGVPARYISSGMSRTEMEIILNNCINSRVKLLYVSPERLKSELFLSYFSKMRINLIAIDEAHCISQWGYDFRPAYLQISSLRDYHPSVPFLALTASATKEVLDDVCDKLNFEEKNILSSKLERDNISFYVIDSNEENKIPKMVELINRIDGIGIVYVRTRNKAKLLARQLSSYNIKALAYHGGMTIAERNHNQEAWMEERTKVIVATTAFGMGINKPNVRFVMHYHLPLSLEAYFQEAGRVGRDGEKAYGIIFNDEFDKIKLKDFVDFQYPNIDMLKTIYNAMGNYYKIPIGTGRDRRFDWDIFTFSENYRLEPFLVANSLRILENSGLVKIEDRGNLFSKIWMPVSKQDLYSFIQDNPAYEALLNSLMSLYPFIMIDFVKISEKRLARTLYQAETDIIDSLDRLEQYGIIHYELRSMHPQLIFLDNRIKSQDLSFSKESYYMMKEVSNNKAKEVIEYVNTKECRQEYLLNYFGNKSKPCSICDNCIDSYSQSNMDEVRKKILSILEKGKRPISYFVDVFGFGKPDTIIPLLRQMLDNKEISYKNGLLGD